jgi:cytochrome c
MGRAASFIFASLTTVGATASAAAAADAAFGEYLSGECVTCHRVDGKDTGIPSIVGWPAEQFIAVLQAYKGRERPNPVMQTIAGRLSNEEIEALAAYYAQLNVPK